MNDLKAKNAELLLNVDEKTKLLGAKDLKIERLNQKIRELENNLGENYKEKDKLRTFEDKIQVLKKRL